MAVRTSVIFICGIIIDAICQSLEMPSMPLPVLNGYAAVSYRRVEKAINGKKRALAHWRATRFLAGANLYS